MRNRSAYKIGEYISDGPSLNWLNKSSWTIFGQLNKCVTRVSCFNPRKHDRRVPLKFFYRPIWLPVPKLESRLIKKFHEIWNEDPSISFESFSFPYRPWHCRRYFTVVAFLPITGYDLTNLYHPTVSLLIFQRIQLLNNNRNIRESLNLKITQISITLPVIVMIHLNVSHTKLVGQDKSVNWA